MSTLHWLQTAFKGKSKSVNRLIQKGAAHPFTGWSLLLFVLSISWFPENRLIELTQCTSSAEYCLSDRHWACWTVVVTWISSMWPSLSLPGLKRGWVRPMSPSLNVPAASKHLGAAYSFFINTAQTDFTLSTSNAHVIDSTQAESELSTSIVPSIHTAQIFSDLSTSIKGCIRLTQLNS